VKGPNAFVEFKNVNGKLDAGVNSNVANMLRYLIDKETGSLDLMINPNTGMTQQLKRRGRCNYYSGSDG